jgi:hypothetical protein
MISAVTDAETGLDAVPISRSPFGSTSSVPTRSRVACDVEKRKTPPAAIPTTSASPVVMSYVTVCRMLTMSLDPGTRPKFHVVGDDHAPLVTLINEGEAEKSGMWSCAV